MLDPRNTVVMTCGVVADPEVVSGNLAKLRVAVDYAGYEKGSDNRSGYFDVVFYMDDSNPNAKFVKSQIEESKMKKGSQIQLVGTLKHRRWESEDGGQKEVLFLFRPKASPMYVAAVVAKTNHQPYQVARVQQIH